MLVILETCFKQPKARLFEKKPRSFVCVDTSKEIPYNHTIISQLLVCIKQKFE